MDGMGHGWYGKSKLSQTHSADVFFINLGLQTMMTISDDQGSSWSQDDRWHRGRCPKKHGPIFVIWAYISPSSPIWIKWLGKSFLWKHNCKCIGTCYKTMKICLYIVYEMYMNMTSVIFKKCKKLYTFAVPSLEPAKTVTLSPIFIYVYIYILVRSNMTT